ncbi:MAG TPA: DUF6603 domain-containing protein [Thermoanaerobaculia bacterium]|jgi:hypothetical protein|nr:DUF6603 domain-containing protein [Thermoanaerobaculia bacterium]
MLPNLQVSLTPSSNGIELNGSRLIISGATSGDWPVQGMDSVALTLQDISIVIVDGSGGVVVDSSAHATLPLSPSLAAPVVVTALHQAFSPWQIRFAGSVAGATPTELLLLGEAGPLPFDVPVSLEVLDGTVTVAPDAFEITFFPNTTFDAIYSLGLSVPGARWTVIADLLEFDGLELNASVTTGSMAVQLVGHPVVGGERLDVGIDLTWGDEWLGFIKPADGAAFPGLAALAAWIGKAALSTGVTDAFTNVELSTTSFDAAIAGITLSFNWRTSTVNYLDVLSELTLGALRLDVVLRLPDVIINGSLHEGPPVSVKDMFLSFGLPADGVPDLSIVFVRFAAEPKHTYYLIEMRVDNDWSAGPLTLQEVGVLVVYDALDGFTGQFECQVAIGTATVAMMAEYGGTEAGWKFAGAMQSDLGVSIGDVLSELAGSFGIGSLPEPVKSLSLSNLSVSYETKTGNFSFICQSGFTIEDTPVALTITIDVTHSQPGDAGQAGAVQGTKGYSATLRGDLQLGGLSFDLAFNTQNLAENVFLATYSHTGTAPRQNIKSLVATVSSAAANFIPGELEIDLHAALFAYSKFGGGSAFLFGLDVDVTGISLSGLPLVGQLLPADQRIDLRNLRVLVASRVIATDLLGRFNSLLPSDVTPLPAEAALNQGATVSAVVDFGGTPRSLELPASAAGTTPSAVPPAASPGVTASASAKWLTVQKQFGPVYFNRVGVQYEDAVLTFLLDAALSASGLTLSLDGLGFGSPLNHFQPTFTLLGLGLDYANGPLEINGAFLRIPRSGTQTYDEYDGAALIKTADLTLSAFGSYAYVNGHPSLFLYAVLDEPFGGPAFFFVTGLAAGFGYNRALHLPPIDQVAQFPLITAVVSPSPSTEMTGMLQQLENEGAVPPQAGEVFLAVGIKFTSFKLIDSFALLTVAFGDELEIDLLGLSTMIAPAKEAGKAVPPLAEIQVAFKASYRPSQGFFAVAAQLTSASFILSRDCHLTGGYAFSSWFSGTNAGDFVSSLGGYHPSFFPPSHYPLVPRLELAWQVNSELAIHGDAYFALTPSLLMAGGALQVTWERDSLKAWCNLSADFLVGWKPFHYDATLSVEMGASYTYHFFGTHHISVDVGADFHLWGPEFSGTAHIDLDIVSFDVAFGAGAANQPAAIPWDGDDSSFKKSFLPADDAVCSIAVLGGGLAKSSDDVWIVNAKDFRLATNSLIPSKEAQCGQTGLSPGGTSEFGIAPMDLRAKDLASQHALSITRAGSAVDGDFQCTPILKSVPAALWWGKSMQPDLNQEQLIENALTGFTITPAHPPTPGETLPIDRSALQYSPVTVADAYGWNEPGIAFTASGQTGDARRQTVRDKLATTATAVSGARNSLLAALNLDPSLVSLNPGLADTFVIPPQVKV